MPTTKGYSVSRSAGGGTGIAAAQPVYSYSGDPDGGEQHCGRNGSYDYPTNAGLIEARVPTLMRGNKAATDFDVTDLADPTEAGTAREGVDSTLVTATTTTISGSGAGLIISFVVTAAGALPSFGTGSPVTTVPTGNDFRIDDAGENYDTNDVVEIDGWPGSRVAVTAA